MAHVSPWMRSSDAGPGIAAQASSRGDDAMAPWQLAVSPQGLGQTFFRKAVDGRISARHRKQSHFRLVWLQFGRNRAGAATIPQAANMHNNQQQHTSRNFSNQVFSWSLAMVLTVGEKNVMHFHYRFQITVVTGPCPTPIYSTPLRFTNFRKSTGTTL